MQMKVGKRLSHSVGSGMVLLCLATLLYVSLAKHAEPERLGVADGTRQTETPLRDLSEVIVHATKSDTLLKQLKVAFRDPPPTQLERDIDAVLNSENSYETQKRFEALFRDVGTPGIRRLKSHPHPGIALRAAWEEVRLTITSGKEHTAVPLDENKLKTFLSFLAMRLRITAPEWWQKTLLGGRAFRRDHLWFPTAPDCEAHDILETSGDKTVIRVGEESVIVPSKVVNNLMKNLGPGRNASAVFGPSSIYLGAHDELGSPYSLILLDRGLARVLWQSTIWATYTHISYMGSGYCHRVGIQLQKGRVIVFGAADGLYVEAFNAEDGANLFRFSTSY
jgi:hypothetical protein